MDDPRRPLVETRSLRGNEALVLDDPCALWVVESGSVALFRADVEAGQARGGRRFCFSVGPGGAVFGLPAVPGGRGVVAVALEPTTLAAARASSVAGGIADAHVAPRDLARGWIGQWEGYAGPIAQGVLDEAAAVEPRALPAVLERFHRALLERLAALEAEQADAERRRLEARGDASARASEEALDRLTSVLRETHELVPRGSPLWVAASAVARTRDVRLRLPPAWDERGALADPVELLARASHCRVRKVLLRAGWWKEDAGALLGFAGAEHRPVALLPRTTRSYEMLDPATGRRTPVDERTAAELDAEAYTFLRPLPADASSGWALARFALGGLRGDLLTILLTGIGATLLGMLTPQALATIVDRAIPDAQADLLLEIGLGLGAAMLGATLFRLAQGIALMRVETAADVVAQSAVWDRLLNLQLGFFRRFSTGDLQSRVSAVSQIRAYLGGTTLRSLFSSVILLLNLGLLLYYSPALTLLALGVALLVAALTVVSGVAILRVSREILRRQGQFFGLMVQLINGVSKLRVAAAEERAFGRWASEYAELVRLDLQRGRIQDAVQVLNLTISMLGSILLFGFTSTLVLREGASLSTGTFLAFYTAFGTFIGAMATLSNTVTDVLVIATLRERVRPILEASPEVHESKADPGRLAGKLELSDVVFRYEEGGPLALDHVSLSVEPGQFVAIVGPSGSGKSTLFRLLLGFETPQSGVVFYDGQDLAGLDVHAVRRQMGVVLQGGRINAGSLYDNVACGARITLADAWQAARATGFAPDVEAMPMGMHTVISEGGTNLSGGQRQRLLLTRALVHRPSILLLDEATSALDNETQATVGRSLAELRVTRVVIAHRLSTIRHADRIFVIESGRIVQQGSFEDLSRERGAFARLIARQTT